MFVIAMMVASDRGARPRLVWLITPAALLAGRRVGVGAARACCWLAPTGARVTGCDGRRLGRQGEGGGRWVELVPGGVSAEAMETSSFAELDAVLLGAPGDARAAVEDADWIVFAFLERDPALFPNSEALKDFLGRGPALFNVRDKQIVVVAYNSPYHLDAGALRNVDLFVALYTKIEPALRTSLRILFQDPSAVRAARSTCARAV